MSKSRIILIAMAAIVVSSLATWLVIEENSAEPGSAVAFITRQAPALKQSASHQIRLAQQQPDGTQLQDSEQQEQQQEQQQNQGNGGGGGK